VCSAYSDLKQEAIASGANGFLAKPIHFAALDEAILNSSK
jgi:DNA-binding NarL/FixJ family response regulator